MVITDRYDHVIDEKGRLAIPSQIRSAMDPQEDGVGFYLMPEGRYLQMIPEKLFKRLSSKAMVGLSPNPQVAKARRLVFGMASFVVPDAQGRVVIPERFLTFGKKRDPFTEAVLGREVTLLGANDRVELWNRSDLEAHMLHSFLQPGLPLPALLFVQDLLSQSGQLAIGRIGFHYLGQQRFRFVRQPLREMLLEQFQPLVDGLEAPNLVLDFALECVRGFAGRIQGQGMAGFGIGFLQLAFHQERAGLFDTLLHLRANRHAPEFHIDLLG